MRDREVQRHEFLLRNRHRAGLFFAQLVHMRPDATHILSIAIAALLIGSAPAAQAVMYRWIDAEGSVTYSNTPPTDPGQVRDLTKIEDMSMVPADKRPKEAGATDKEKGSGGSAAAQPGAGKPAKSDLAPSRTEPLPRNADVPVTLRDMQALPRESTVAKPEPSTLPREPRAVQRESESAPPVTRGVQAEAVRDPCLRSADPKCHERNKDRYHPYLGYAPGTMRPAAAPAVGASSGSGAGGAVGGAIRR